MRMNLNREQAEAERYLLRDARNEGAMRSSLLKLERAESARGSITGSIEAFSLSPSQRDKMLDALASMDDSIDEIRRCARRFGKCFSDAEFIVSEVERADGDAGRVLRMRYIDRESMTNIANRMGFSRKHVYDLLKRGLDAAYRIGNGGGTDG